MVADTPWVFPPATEWPEDDLITAGADLESSTLVAAYRCGLFPMPIHGTNLLGWWSPDPRGILPIEGLRVTRSLRQSARRYEIRVDTCFAEVMRGCADPSREYGWIDDQFIDAYTRLHALGWAHSVEAFDSDGGLAGGLYGVRVNGLFAGESMFHVKRDASKAALLGLVALMRESGMVLLDVQWATAHLCTLGAVEISRRDYLERLEMALDPSGGSGIT